MFIDALETLVPDAATPLADFASGTSERELIGFARLFGHSHVRSFCDPAPVANRLCTLLDRLSEDAVCFDAVIYAHALPVEEEGSDLHELLRAHPAVACSAGIYEIDQYHCAAGLAGLHMAQKLIETGLATRIALLIGDELSALPDDFRYVPGVTALGDAFAGLVLCRDGHGPRVTDFTLRHACRFPHGALADRAELAAFFAAHDGCVADLLEVSGHGDGDLLFAHNINLPAWRKIPVRADLSLVGDFGHCFAADPFLTLARHLKGGAAEGSATLLAIGLGSFAAVCRVHIPASTLSHQET